MFYIPKSVGVILAVSPKCASTSFRNTFHVSGTRPLSLDAVKELKKSYWKVVGVVRDPIDRFESCWNFFQYGQNGEFPVGKFATMQDFIDAVLDGLRDEHWIPQSQMLLECDSFVDLESFPLSHHDNKSDRKDSVVYRLDELKEFYKEDYLLRGNSCQL